MSLILQIEQALRVTPYGTYVFGFLTFVLCIAVVILWKDLKDERNFAKDLSQQTLVLLTKFEDKVPNLAQIPEIKQGVNEIRTKLEQYVQGRKD
jgi:hypothetical protein